MEKIGFAGVGAAAVAFNINAGIGMDIENDVALANIEAENLHTV